MLLCFNIDFYVCFPLIHSSFIFGLWECLNGRGVGKEGRREQGKELSFLALDPACFSMDVVFITLSCRPSERNSQGGGRGLAGCTLLTWHSYWKVPVEVFTSISSWRLQSFRWTGDTMSGTQREHVVEGWGAFLIPQISPKPAVNCTTHYCTSWSVCWAKSAYHGFPDMCWQSN